MAINEIMEDDGVQQIKASEDVRNEIDLETGQRYAKLYVAALGGDWGKAEAIYKDYPDDAVASLSDLGNNALHVAAEAGRINFVKQLVMSNYMKENDLEKKNHDGNTAFTLAAMSGNVELALLMIEKNKKLAMIRNDSGMLPVQIAALLGLKKMVNYLYKITREELEDEDRIELLVNLIDNASYDVALVMVVEHPELAGYRIKGDENKIGETALHALARKPLTFNDHFDNSKQGIWKRCCCHLSGTSIEENKKMNPKALELVKLLWEIIVARFDYYKISELIRKPWPLTYVAAKEGNLEFLSILIKLHPALIFNVDENGYSIFHTAVKYRQENIFQLVYKLLSIRDVIVVSQGGDERNTILHLAAELPPDPNRLNVGAGAALHMQRELFWFKEVGKLVPTCFAEIRNRSGKTARTLFTENHTKLMKEGEEWMKRTAESCMLVATLIATIVFSAAITVPGGVKEGTGAPNFLKKAAFTNFAISDTISMVSSSCSILTFLSVFTARYAEEEFLSSLPRKLLVGFSTLFVSVIAMMVVFCATVFIVFYEGTIGPFIVAVVLASIPVLMSIFQQNHLLFEVIRLMYLSKCPLHRKLKSSLT